MFGNDSSEPGKVLNSIHKKELFTVPEGYFDAFPATLVSHIVSAPFLYSLEKKESHIAPEGYFEAFSAGLSSHIGSAPVLHSLEKKEFNAAPEGYFEAFSVDLASRLQVAPVLYSLEKKEFFEQPVAYADQLHAKIMAADVPAKEAKIVSFPAQVLRWTAVAALLVVMFPLSYLLADDHKAVNQAVQMAEMSDADVYEEYLSNETNIDDAISFYVNEVSAEAAAADTPAELDYLLEEDVELENF